MMSLLRARRTTLEDGEMVDGDTQFWLNLQTHDDLDLAEDRVADQIAAIAPLKVA